MASLPRFVLHVTTHTDANRQTADASKVHKDALKARQGTCRFASSSFRIMRRKSASTCSTPKTCTVNCCSADS